MTMFWWLEYKWKLWLQLFMTSIGWVGFCAPPSFLTTGWNVGMMAILRAPIVDLKMKAMCQRRQSNKQDAVWVPESSKGCCSLDFHVIEKCVLLFKLLHFRSPHWGSKACILTKSFLYHYLCLLSSLFLNVRVFIHCENVIVVFHCALSNENAQNLSL